MADTAHGFPFEGPDQDDRRPRPATPARDEAHTTRPDSERLTPRHLAQLQSLGGNAAVAALVGPTAQRMMAAPTPAPPLPVTTPAPAQAPAPALAAEQMAGNKEGLCGNFRRRRRWQVTNPVQGLIVQHIERTFNVWNATGQLAGGALDDYVTDPGSTVHATETTYWEAWRVNAGGGVSYGGVDTFGLCSLIPSPATILNTTWGSFTMTGSATFHPTKLAAATFGLIPHTIAAAGGLLSSAAAPNMAAAPPAGDPVVYTVHVTWDSRPPAAADWDDPADPAYSQVVP